MIGVDIATAASLVLAVVFAWAGAAKVVNAAATTSSFSQLGLPAPAALARAVPIIELGLAVALVLGLPGASVVGAALLLAFTAVLARVVRRGVVVTCSCFGAASAEPVSVVDIARNVLLIGLCALSLGAGSGWPDLPSLIVVSLLALIGRVGLGVLRLSQLTPLWPAESQR